MRGNTYAQNVLPATEQPDPLEIQRQQVGLVRSSMLRIVVQTVLVFRVPEARLRPKALREL